MRVGEDDIVTCLLHFLVFLCVSCRVIPPQLIESTGGIVVVDYIGESRCVHPRLALLISAFDSRIPLDLYI